MPHHNKFERYVIEMQYIDLSNFYPEGLVLDVGGGGEGIVGQILGDKVVAIDPRKNELDEAPAGGLKIVMDARDLGFLDNSFDSVTSFFTMMYLKNSDHKQVYEEIYRVLKPGGRFYLWDLSIPKCEVESKCLYLTPIDITLPEKHVKTGYGTLWNDKIQNRSHFIEHGESIGLEIEESSENGKTFFIVFHKQ